MLASQRVLSNPDNEKGYVSRPSSIFLKIQPLFEELLRVLLTLTV
jgi:hypothetical protein